MKFIADFHIHSKYSRATSPEMNLESLENLIVHELVHTHLSIMQADVKPSQQDDYQKLVELTTTLVTEALLWVRDFAIKGKIPPEA